MDSLGVYKQRDPGESFRDKSIPIKETVEVLGGHLLGYVIWETIIAQVFKCVLCHLLFFPNVLLLMNPCFPPYTDTR